MDDGSLHSESDTTPCRRVRNDQLATLKQHGGRRRRPSGLWSICVSGDRCGDAVGFSLSTRRQCNGRRQAERDRQKIAAIPASASILPRSWHWARAAPPTVAARTRIVSRPEFGWITGNLCDLSKGYFATTFLSSSPTLPATQCDIRPRGGAKINVARAGGREHPAAPARGLSIYGSRCPPISSHG